MRPAAWVLVLVSSGCAARGSARTPTSGLAAGSPAAMSGGPIEASCSLHGDQLKGDVGSEFEVSCPDGCAARGGSWGTEFYTIDSPICRAAIHFGAIPASGGIVHVRIEAGRTIYRGSMRNGIESYDYGAYVRSFVVSRP